MKRCEQADWDAANAPEEHEFLGMRAVIASEEMRALMEVVKRVAPSDAAVLITGESGTGKELVARALHWHSPRCLRPWIDINCGALPENLIESELFGYERGAFTGANAPKQGLFELAHSGTLFLDEIGEIDSRTQVKLLRVLEGASYYRLGGVKKLSVDVRVIAATNMDLAGEVAAGRFRVDLYHRLSQCRVHVPALRERPGDAGALAAFFLRQQNPNLRLSQDARAFIAGCSWPGNIRELRNTIVRAAILSQGPEIRASDLEAGGTELAAPDFNLDRIEMRTIRHALAATGGHQQKAAELLGISPRTLYRKLKHVGLEAGSAQACSAPRPAARGPAAHRGSEQCPPAGPIPDWFGFAASMESTG